MLQALDLAAGYSRRTIVREVSFTLEPGQLMTLIGPNGCGKSTLLRTLGGLLMPHRGEALLEGENTARLEPRQRGRRLAFLPQHSEGGSDLTVEEMVLLGRTPYLDAYGTPRAADRKSCEEALRATSLLGLRHRRCGELSGGERQRVLFARALAQEPRLFLLDEPVSNLDIRYQQELLSLVRRMVRGRGLACVLVLHQINLAALLADQMLLLAPDGTAAAQGDPAAVMREEVLRAVYGVNLRVDQHPRTGRPQAYSLWNPAEDEEGT